MKPETREALDKQRDEIFEHLYEALPQEAYAGTVLAALGQLCCAVIEHVPLDKRKQALECFIKSLAERVDLESPALGSSKECTEDEVLFDGIIGHTVGEA